MADHNAQVETKHSINSGAVAPGMILEFTYTKIDKKGKQSSGKYMIVATSDFIKRPQDTVKMLHGVTLEVVSKGGLEQLAKNTGLEWANSSLKARKLKIEKITVKDAKGYYAGVIKSALGGALKGSYRTFRKDRIGAIKICEYKWPKELLLEDAANTKIKTIPIDPDIPKLDQG